MRLMHLGRMNKILLFIERKSITIVEFLCFFSAILLLILLKDHQLNQIIRWYNNFLTSYNSELITIATIFIGIHFTVYTLLMSASSSSTYSNLSSSNKSALLRVLNHSFLTSFIYVIYSLVHKYMITFMPVISTLIMLGLLIVLIYSSFIFGVFMYRIIKNDILNEIEDGNSKDVWDE